MTFFILGCALLFFAEAGIGTWWPTVYALLTPGARRAVPWRLPFIGSGLVAWGLVGLAVAVPLDEPRRWLALVLSLLLLLKGTIVAVWPTRLRDTPEHLRSSPRRWRLQCAMRAVMGIVLLATALALR